MKRKNKTTFKLKRTLGLTEATFYGIGIILGAGIYAIIGEGAKVAQGSLWISFVIAAIIGSFTGLSYAEMSGRFSKEAAEYNYTKKAFNRNYLSFIIAWIMIIAGVFSVSAVSLGFAGYFTNLFGGAPILVAIVLIVLLSLLNWFGIKESARFNMLSTLIEMGGLVLVVLIGIFLVSSNGFGSDLLTLPATGLAGIMTAVGLIFFAYIGFEDVANMSEEVKNPQKTVPKALIISIALTTILYILVSVFAISSVGWETLANSKAPLTTIADKGLGPSGIFIMSLIALFATANTALIIMIVISRILYGVSCQKDLPKMFSRIGNRGTPYISVFTVAIVCILALFLGGLKIVASLTDIGIFIVYLFVNLSLIKLRFSKKDRYSGFRTPLNIGKFPVLAFLGVLTSAGMLFFFDPFLIFAELAVILGGFAVYKIVSKK